MTEPTVAAVSVELAAPPEDVFLYLTDAARYVTWMGQEATLEPRPGGRYRVQTGDGFAAAGSFLELAAPHRVAFTWGWEPGAGQTVLTGPQPDDALPPGSSRVVITLQACEAGTFLSLEHHDLRTAALRNGHRIAWQTYLQRLATRIEGGDPGLEPHRKGREQP